MSLREFADAVAVEHVDDFVDAVSGARGEDSGSVVDVFVREQIGLGAGQAFRGMGLRFVHWSLRVGNFFGRVGGVVLGGARSWERIFWMHNFPFVTRGRGLRVEMDRVGTGESRDELPDDSTCGESRGWRLRPGSARGGMRKRLGPRWPKCAADLGWRISCCAGSSCPAMRQEQSLGVVRAARAAVGGRASRLAESWLDGAGLAANSEKKVSAIACGSFWQSPRNCSRCHLTMSREPIDDGGLDAEAGAGGGSIFEGGGSAERLAGGSSQETSATAHRTVLGSMLRPSMPCVSAGRRGV